METINSIKLSEDNFMIFFDKSSLNLKFQEDEKRYFIDLSNFSLLEATKIAILTSTYCFLKNFNKKLCWLVNDIETYHAIGVLKLKNIEQKLIAKNEERLAIAR